MPTASQLSAIRRRCLCDFLLHFCARVYSRSAEKPGDFRLTFFFLSSAQNPELIADRANLGGETPRQLAISAPQRAISGPLDRAVVESLRFTRIKADPCPSGMCTDATGCL